MGKRGGHMTCRSCVAPAPFWLLPTGCAVGAGLGLWLVETSLIELKGTSHRRVRYPLGVTDGATYGTPAAWCRFKAVLFCKMILVQLEETRSKEGCTIGLATRLWPQISKPIDAELRHNDAPRHAMAILARATVSGYALPACSLDSMPLTRERAGAGLWLQAPRRWTAHA